jgi:arginase
VCVFKNNNLQIAYIGLRDIDDGERKILRELEAQGMYVSTMYDIDALGIGQVMKAALDSLGKDRPIHVSYDIDALVTHVS